MPDKASARSLCVPPHDHNSQEKLEASQSINNLASEVDYIGWDQQKNEPFAGKAGLSDLPVKIGGGKEWTKAAKGAWQTETVVDTACHDAEEARQLAAGRLQENSYQYGHAEGEGEGNQKLMAGMRVTVKMAGEGFDGEYMAEAVTHRFGRGGYRTSFALKRNMGE